MVRLNTPLSRAAGALFGAVAALVFALDQFTALQVSSGFENASPVTVALGIAAVITVAVVSFVTDSAFEE